MKISGFTFIKNTSKLYYPLKESILSILDICDEFIVAYAKGDEDDQSYALLNSIKSDKIKLIESVWDMSLLNGSVYAQQTNIALAECSGDWCFYLQSDECVHEKYLPIIQSACDHYLNDNDVDAFLFRYKHFWGDYQHYYNNRGWYPKEIRIIRNNAGIQSYRDAQSFRKNNMKCKSVEIPAEIFHYGWVRPPKMMAKKTERMRSLYAGETEKSEIIAYDYGNLSAAKLFVESHPKVMNDWIKQFNWQDQLSFTKHPLNRPKMKHERLKYKAKAWFEDTFLGGNEIFGFKNYIKIDNYPK